MELFWQGVSDWDQQLFLALNGIHSPFSDFLFKWITYKYTWTPLYLYLFYVIFKSYRREGVAIILLSLAAVILADYFASGIMKPYFARHRPCHDPLIGHLVHNVVGCGGKFGFSSSHASTSFALATAFFLFTREKLKGMKWMFLWAAVYAYSRVAVGVHYPGDIFVGAVVGALTSIIIVWIYFYFRQGIGIKTN